MTTYELLGRKVNIETISDAKTLLLSIESGVMSFPPTADGARQYRKLLDFSISDMKDSIHRSDCKRSERRHGQMKRERHNGSGRR